MPSGHQIQPTRREGNLRASLAEKICMHLDLLREEMCRTLREETCDRQLGHTPPLTPTPLTQSPRLLTLFPRPIREEESARQKCKKRTTMGTGERRQATKTATDGASTWMPNSAKSPRGEDALV